MRRLLAALTLVLASLAGSPADSDADVPLSVRLIYLTPLGVPPSWHATDDFQLAWGIGGDQGAVVPAGVAYRIRAPSGGVLGPVSRTGFEDGLVTVRIPPLPGQPAPGSGEYLFEIWLESWAGDGPHLTAPLRFDNSRPAAPQAIVSEDWIRAGSETEVRIEPPPGARPLSGIRGYAVELDHGSGGGPCGGRDRCRADEVDLPGGEGDDTILVRPLAEGVNVVRAVTVSGSGMSSEPSAGAELRVDGSPPEVTLAGIDAGWSDGPVEISARAVDELSGMAPDATPGGLTAIAIDHRAATVTAGASAVAVVRGEGVHDVGAYARDAVGNLSAGGGDSDPPVLASVRIDETAPAVAFAPAEDPAEPERIVAVVADALAGPDPQRGSIGLRPAGSSQPFEPLPTAATAGRLTTRWDSDSYPAGRYEFRATAFDLAGNRTATERRRNGERMVLDNPLKTPTALAFGFGGGQLVWHRCRRRDGELRCHRALIGPYERRPAARWLPYGRGTPVGGRLSAASGPLAAGLAVQVTEIFEPGSEASERRTTVLTDAKGEFLAHLPPGPSRQIEVSFGGSPVLTRAGGRELRLSVRSAVRLRASTATATIGGAPVVFRGAVAHEGATVPATGLPVELQYRLPGTSWSEFRTVQTGPDGRFRYPYAFSDDDSRGVRFQFRARVAALAGWPFDPGTSRPVAVTGR